jgi:hypothetical protein
MRSVAADTVLSGGADLRGYPHRFISVRSERGWPQERMLQVLQCAEFLEQWGWELISVGEFGRNDAVFAVLRRR